MPGPGAESEWLMSEIASWRAPPAKLELAQDEVHVWRLALQQPPAEIERLRRLLAAEERARAARFRFEHDRRRFTVSHGVLRLILGRYLQQSPEALRYELNAYGKPALAGPARWLSFNLSHSGEMALVTVAADRAVGVDVERMRTDVAGEEIASKYFSEREMQELSSLPPAQRTEAFFLCWTRKEAFIKAVGEGVSYPLAQFDVSLTPGARPCLHRVGEDPTEVGRWTLVGLEPGPGYAGALVAAGRPQRIRLWQWQTR